MSEIQGLNRITRLHPRSGSVPTLRLTLLGGFRVERTATQIVGWQRRGAKTLIKLLATHPQHALHREQIVEILWPGVEFTSALNSFGKTLHAARRALEPELTARRPSAYVRFADSVVMLDPQHVEVDADRFQQLSGEALRRRDVATYESALAAYGGELLPEDRYEDWCLERRRALSELRVRVLLGLADALAVQGCYDASADRLREVVEEEPTREDVHRRLIRAYAEMGNREQAARQFHTCREVLRRELELAPQRETLSLYQDVLADRIPARALAPAPAPDIRPAPAPDIRPTPSPDEPPVNRAFIGRESALRQLRAQLEAREGGPGMILVSGEPGVGKTRLLEEFADEASQAGAAVLFGGTGAGADDLAYGTFALALEGYAASRSEEEREALAHAYPALARFVPSVSVNGAGAPSRNDRWEDHRDFLLAIVRLLTELGRKQPVVIVAGDLEEADPVSLDLARYLARFAPQRRWLLVAAVREEELDARTEVGRTVERLVRERLCLKLDLPCLSRPDCDQLVRELIGGAASDELLEHVHAQSRGNPLFVEELIGEMRVRSELVLAEGCWHRSSRATIRVPARVRALTAVRLGVVDDCLHRVLALAATIGRPEITLRELISGAAALQPPISADALFDALDRAIRIRVLEQAQTGYRFRQPLVRSALFEELPLHRQNQLRAALSAEDGNPRKLAVAAGGLEAAGGLR